MIHLPAFGVPPQIFMHARVKTLMRITAEPRLMIQSVRKGPDHGCTSRLSAFRAGGATGEAMHSDDPEGKVNWGATHLWSLTYLPPYHEAVDRCMKSDPDAMVSDGHHKINASITLSIAETIW